MNNTILAFTLSLLAGLSTGLGGCIGLFFKKNNPKYLAITLGFAAGVMIYVSMVKIFDESIHILSSYYGQKIGTMYTMIGFFSGMLLTELINKFIPNKFNLLVIRKKRQSKVKLMRTGLITALVIFIHNFPEGITSFITSLYSFNVGIPIVIAIAIHNIPEGISVSVPIYYATGSKEKAFMYSFISGMAEPIGALVGYLFLIPFMNKVLFGLIYSVIAGIMVYISFKELLPTAREYGENYLSIYGLVGGMFFMASSLWLFI